jgi:tetratricopeptide (TPR) repeat protein
MMVERHYDDEALISLIETNRAGLDAHLPSCKPCSEKLQSVRAIAGTLHDASVWDTRPLREEPNRTTIANLRAFADRMTFEDTRAETYLHELLDGPRETWMAKLHAHPEWRTAGVVRKLIAAASRAIDTMPPDAVEMTAVATQIADRLDPNDYESDSVSRLRGAAWRERAYALYYTGLFAEALDATNRAEALFERCVVDEYERARVNIVRALVLRAKGEITPALASAGHAASTFARFEDVSRGASARLAEVHLLISQDKYEDAAAILEAIEAAVRQADDVDTHARIFSNLGHCYWKLGRLDESLQHHDMAAALFDHIGVPTESARLRWNIALILVTAGRIDEALLRFGVLKTDFERLEMRSEAAVISLDIAEILLARGDFGTVEQLCRDAIACFKVAGILHGTRALTALAYIHEAACLRTATPKLAKHVRDFLRRLPEDHTLLFAPPPF